MLPVRGRGPGLLGPSGVGGGGWGSAGLLSLKAAGSGSGRRVRIREAKDSLEARVVRARVVGGMVLGGWAGLGGVDEVGGVGGRGRKNGIFRGDSLGEFVVLDDSELLSVVLAAVASPVFLL